MARAIHEAQPGVDPVVLLDVDGVLLVQSEKPQIGAKELIDPLFGDGIGHMLPAIAKGLNEVRKQATIVWMTSHHEDANRHIGPAMGLPPLDWVHLPGTPQPHYPCSDLNTERIGAIDNYYPDRVVVWVDDNIEPEDEGWRQTREAAGYPTLIVQPDSERGLQVTDLDLILSWLGDHTTK